MYKYFSLLITSLALFACTSEPVQPPTAKLSGTIDGLNNKTLLLMSKTDVDTIKLDSVGHFTFEKEYSAPTYSKLVLGRSYIPLYLTNNTDLTLKTTKKDFGKSVEFKGEGAKENQLLIDRDQLTFELNYFPAIFKLSPEQFIAKSDSIKQLYIDLGEKYSKNENVDTTFLKLYNVDVKYEQLSYYTMYAPYHQYFTKEEAKLPEAANKEMEAAIVDRADYAKSDNYIKFIGSMYERKFIEEFPEARNANSNILPKIILWLDSKIKSHEVKNPIFFKAVESSITNVGEEDRDKIYAAYSKVNTDSFYQKKIDEKYNSFENLRKGKPAVQWSYPDINGKEHSLADFKGKYVYIDVWATWCGPCKAEIPELVKLVKDYKNKDIVFVSVSVDTNEAASKKMLSEHNYDWTQLHAKEAWNSEIVKGNNIMGIPRFMMIDREGNIVDVNAPRPSSDKIRPMIDNLLKQK